MNLPNGKIVITSHDHKLLDKFISNLNTYKKIFYYPECSLKFNELLNFTSEIKEESDCIIQTQSPWIISDFDQKNVFVVNDDGILVHPEFQTFGASVNKITMCLLDKKETIGIIAKCKLDEIYNSVNNDPDKASDAINQIAHAFGDSIEKTLIIKTLIDIEESKESKESLK